MKKYYQYFGLALITIFSFYYTEQISLIVLNKNPLMKTIHEKADDYSVKSVNAEISGDSITPGINGLEINVKESFYLMQKEDVFNQYYLVFDQVKPNVSLEDHKDKIIRVGNRLLKRISFVLESEGEISKYFLQNHLPASLLATLSTYKQNSGFELINYEVEGFKSLENTLNLNKENKHLCIVHEENKQLCKKNKNYLIDPILKLNQTNVIEVKSKIGNGSIVFIGKNATLSDVKLILKEVQYKDLEVVFLSKMISEENKNN